MYWSFLSNLFWTCHTHLSLVNVLAHRVQLLNCRLRDLPTVVRALLTLTTCQHLVTITTQEALLTTCQVVLIMAAGLWMASWRTLDSRHKDSLMRLHGHPPLSQPTRMSFSPSCWQLVKPFWQLVSPFSRNFFVFLFFFCRSKKIRTRAAQCFILNGLIFVGSILLFNSAVVPLLHWLFDNPIFAFNTDKEGHVVSDVLKDILDQILFTVYHASFLHSLSQQ